MSILEKSAFHTKHVPKNRYFFTQLLFIDVYIGKMLRFHFLINTKNPIYALTHQIDFPIHKQHVFCSFFHFSWGKSLINKWIKSLDKSRNSITCNERKHYFKLMIFSHHHLIVPLFVVFIFCQCICGRIAGNHSSHSLKIHAFHYHLFSLGGLVHLFSWAQIYLTFTSPK